MMASGGLELFPAAFGQVALGVDGQQAGARAVRHGLRHALGVAITGVTKRRWWSCCIPCLGVNTPGARAESRECIEAAGNGDVLEEAHLLHHHLLGRHGPERVEDEGDHHREDRNGQTK
jgi:hypothetical protein